MLQKLQVPPCHNQEIIIAPPPVDLSRLTALEALLEESRVAGAFRRMNLSPPAASRTLARICETTVIRSWRGLGGAWSVHRGRLPGARCRRHKHTLSKQGKKFWFHLLLTVRKVCFGRGSKKKSDCLPLAAMRDRKPAFKICSRYKRIRQQYPFTIPVPAWAAKTRRNPGMGGMRHMGSRKQGGIEPRGGMIPKSGISLPPNPVFFGLFLKFT